MSQARGRAAKSAVSDAGEWYADAMQSRAGKGKRRAASAFMRSSAASGSERRSASRGSHGEHGAAGVGGRGSRAARRASANSQALARAGRAASRRHQRPKQHRRKRPLWLRIILWLANITGVLMLLGLIAFAILYITTDIPQPEKVAMASKTTVYYADGRTEIGTFASQNREIIDCKALPDYVGKAIVASENRTFYTDNGIDLRGIGRALFNNITTGSRQGGSTITQQYAERYYLGETKSYLGKLHEAILALKISQSQHKDQVLCNYMNTIYLGRGAYGIQAAAKAYFNKPASQLTLPEAALLAGIIPAPSAWDPADNPAQAQKRFNRVLTIMSEDGYLHGAAAGGVAANDATTNGTAANNSNASNASNSNGSNANVAADAATAAAIAQPHSATMPPTIAPQQQRNAYAGHNGYLLQMVRDELTGHGAFTKEDLDTGGYAITTTIDKAKQDLMFAVASPSQALARRARMPQGVEVGALSADPRNGAIVAIYAGDDYLKKQLNNATQALYEPGSTMKPFALLGAIEQGVSLNTLFNGNSPQRFPGISDPVKNFANQSYGSINLYKATADSVNTVYMKVQEKLGAAKVAQVANNAGVDPKLVNGKNPFTVLGNDGVHVKDIAQAYATIANKGAKPTLHIVASVKSTAGKEMYQAPTGTTPVFNENDAALAIKAMTGTIQYGTATEARAVRKTLAGKSGTANDETAGSFVGFTPNLVSVFAIWHPGANGAPQKLPTFSGYEGSAYPIHLFTRFMTGALAGAPNEQFPNAVDHGKVGGADGSWGLGARRIFAPLAPLIGKRSDNGGESNGGAAANGSGNAGANAGGMRAGNDGNSGNGGAGASSGNAGGALGNGSTNGADGQGFAGGGVGYGAGGAVGGGFSGDAGTGAGDAGGESGSGGE